MHLIGASDHTHARLLREKLEGTGGVACRQIVVAPGGVGKGNPLYQSPFGLLSATLAFDIDAYKTTISFWGRNILNKRYMESGTCLVALGLGSCWAAYGAPATYGADVTIRF